MHKRKAECLSLRINNYPRAGNSWFVIAIVHFGKKKFEYTDYLKRNGQIMIHWSLEVQQQCDEADGGSLLILFLCLTRDLSVT